MYTLRGETGTRDGLLSALDRIAEMGWDGIQASAIGCLGGEVTFADLRAMLDERCLGCGATHRPWDLLSGDPEGEIERHRELGCSYTALGMAPGEVIGGGPQEWREFIEGFRRVHDRLAEGGLRLGYHNHASEFQKKEGASFMQALVAEEWLPLEVDTYWVQLGGVDPVRFLSKLGSRLEVVHLKDVNVWDNAPDMSPIGEGNLDWPEILSALRAGGCDWAMVEQDEFRRDPFDCLASSLRFLRAYSSS